MNLYKPCPPMWSTLPNELVIAPRGRHVEKNKDPPAGDLSAVRTACKSHQRMFFKTTGRPSGTILHPLDKSMHNNQVGFIARIDEASGLFMEEARIAQHQEGNPINT